VITVGHLSHCWCEKTTPTFQLLAGRSRAIVDGTTDLEGDNVTGWLDVHAHYVTDRYAAQCAKSAIGSSPDGMPGWPGWSVDAALELMEKTGVGAAVLSVSSPGVHFGDASSGENRAARELARHVNDFGAEVVALLPERFGLSAVLPLPDVDGSLAEVARVYDHLRADAIALETNYHGRYLSDPEFEPVLAELNSREAVVTLHPTSPPGWQQTALGRPRPMIEFLFDTTRCVADLALSGTLVHYPRISWIVPHAGATLPVVAHRIAGMSLLSGTPVDMPSLLRGLYYDLAGVPLPIALDSLLAVTTPDRLLYGSDFPFTSAEAATWLAAGLRNAPALHGAQLSPVPGSAAGKLFPRLCREDSAPASAGEGSG
jgi:predicted TIM-barrel fold metal-dependent hydrolase